MLNLGLEWVKMNIDLEWVHVGIKFIENLDDWIPSSWRLSFSWRKYLIVLAEINVSEGKHKLRAINAFTLVMGWSVEY